MKWLICRKRNRELANQNVSQSCFDTFSKVQRPTAEYKAYDLVAVYPKTEKLFHVERGVFFERAATPPSTIANSVSSCRAAIVVRLHRETRLPWVLYTLGRKTSR
ncbi:hypothetical protein J4Q44_G00013580 [Coregonus suidteri]|uniref:Uncharacterized protein n=1 Tax=Coregonus suidteri TaxID=861788 RepID=A0AAN8MRM1_9TELE